MTQHKSAFSDHYARQTLLPGTISQFILPFNYVVPKPDLSSESTASEADDGQLTFQPQERIYNYQEELHAEKTLTKQAQKPQFLHESKLLKSRLDYLANDTQKALFERACWYSLHQPQKLCLAQFNNSEVMAQKVQLVLFEQAQNDVSINELQTGFLILDVFLHNPDEKPTLNELLDFNAAFRYLTPPFAGYERLDPGQHWVPLIKPVANLCKLKQRISEELDCPESERTMLAERAMRFAGMFLQFLLLPIQNHRSEQIQIANPQQVLHSMAKLGLFSLKESAEPSKAHNPINPEQGDLQELMVYPDNRLFCRCYAELKQGGFSLLPEEITTSSKKAPCNAETLEHCAGQLHYNNQWISLLNVDNGPAEIGQGSDFEKHWVEQQRTYQRWQHFGTLYGFSYNCCAAISMPCEEPPLKRHFVENHLDITLLLLYTRVSLFRFSQALNLCTQSAIKDGEHAKNTEGFERLRLYFALFVNLYKFPLISNQQQAIEMFNLQRTSMDIDELFTEIDSEIKNTHEALQLVEISQQTKETQTLNKTVLYVGLLGVIATLFTINDRVTFYKEQDSKDPVKETESTLDKQAKMPAKQEPENTINNSASELNKKQPLDKDSEQVKQESLQPESDKNTSTDNTENKPDLLTISPQKGTIQQEQTNQVSFKKQQAFKEKPAPLNKTASVSPQNNEHLVHPIDEVHQSHKGFSLSLDAMWVVIIALCVAILLKTKKDVQSYLASHKTEAGVFVFITLVFAGLAQYQVTDFTFLTMLLFVVIVLLFVVKNKKKPKHVK